jgi:hypothetical protein
MADSRLPGVRSIAYLDWAEMNHVVAYKLLADELAAYRQLPADDARQLVGEHSSRLVRGEDGVDYKLDGCSALKLRR